MSEPKTIYNTKTQIKVQRVAPAPNGRLPTCPPSPAIEAIVRQQISAIVEVYKLDGKRVKVIIVEKS